MKYNVALCFKIPCFETTHGLSPSFLLAKRYLTIKPSMGIFFTQKRKVYLQMALTNVYQRDAISNQNFGYLNVEMGIQLF
ncbi:MAG: hypothetical protein EAZ38_01745 [Cytophagales bacterium]|nr:MAG: hypothetical protein EAZ46_12280 [Runella sp.]TAG24112.1 MAG: hypothetical protein EAZ38_01745 [Cytophagales bacterium]